MRDGHEFPSYRLEIGLEYRRLAVRSLGSFLVELGAIADLSVEMYAEAVSLPRAGLPTLEIEESHTGGSIKFVFNEGWLPSVTSDHDNDIVINVPKKLGIPLLVGYLLLNSASEIVSLRNSCLDGRLKELEIQIKEAEIQKGWKRDSALARQLQHRGKAAAAIIIKDNDYSSFTVDGIDLLSRPGNQDDDGIEGGGGRS